jgi:glycogen synthase
MNIDSNKKVLLFFGLIRDYKGLDLLLKAMSELDEDFILLIAGECYGSFKSYQDIIQEHKLVNKVKCKLEFISDAEVAPYFSASDLCILPYKHATQSGVIAVAEHFDLPCLVTNVGGLEEHVLHNETGFVVRESDSSVIAQGIREAFVNKRLESWSEAISNKKQNNSWSNFVDKLIDMGAKIMLCDPHRAVVMGHNFKSQLKATVMSSPDIRAGISLLIAALSAKGTSTIQNIEQIDRGYERIDERLRALGANIVRV